MTLADGIVLAAGIVAIAWVNWYFLLAEPALDAPHDHDHGGMTGHASQIHREPRR